MSLLILTVSDPKTTDEEVYSTLFITIFSMVFTTISIILSIFEYCFTCKNKTKKDCVSIVQFKVESSDFQSMTYPQFCAKIVYRRMGIIGTIGKLLAMPSQNIERLKPVHYTKGVFFTFLIYSSPSHPFVKIKAELENSIKDKTLQRELNKIFNFSDGVKISKFDTLISLEEYNSMHMETVNSDLVNLKRNTYAYDSNVMEINNGDNLDGATNLSRIVSASLSPSGSGSMNHGDFGFSNDIVINDGEANSLNAHAHHADTNDHDDIMLNGAIEMAHKDDNIKLHAIASESGEFMS